VTLGDAHGTLVGGRELVVIAGPCSVEGREMLQDTAHAVLAAGARALRGGAFKPRTSPYDFQGLGMHGLELLAEARRVFGLPFVTEVMKFDPSFTMSDAAFKTARRWAPKKKYDSPEPPQLEAPKVEVFKVGDRVRYKGGPYGWLKGYVGTVRIVSGAGAETIGVLYDEFPDGRHGHDMNGELKGDEAGKGWFCAPVTN
jgi:hypothetical protein